MRIRIGGYVTNDDTAKLYRRYGYQNVCCPQDIREALKLPEDAEGLIFEVNSGGGSVYAGYEMYTVLKNAKRKSTIEIQSVAASAASVFAMAGDQVVISPVASIMIHRASSWADGNEEDMSRAAQMLRTTDEGILNAYEIKCGEKTDRDTLRELMKNETFFTAQEAVERGFADGILWQQEDPDSRLTNSITAMAGGWNMIMANLPPIEELKRRTPGGENITGRPETKTKEENKMTLEEMTAQHPELLAQIRNEAANAERNRISGIDAVAMEGFEDIVAAAKDDPNATGESVAKQIIEAAKKQGKNFLAARTEDAEDSGANGVGAEKPAGKPENEVHTILDKLLPKE